MTKSEARAILQLKKTVERSISLCLSRLKGDEKTFAENYWALHLETIVAGEGYGSLPLERVLSTLTR